VNTGIVASTTMALALVTSLLAEIEAGLVLTVARAESVSSLLAMVSPVSGVIVGGIAAGHMALSSSVTPVTVLVSLHSGRKTK
jgi:hypothetical protein